MDSVTAGYYTLDQKINKVHGKDPENVDSVSQDLLPEIYDGLSDEELIDRTNQWEASWKSSTVYQTWLDQGKEAHKYWIGKHYGKAEGETNRPIIDNAIFEALETFLPVATKRNPEPLVRFVNSADDIAYPNIKQYFKEKLDYLTEHLSIRLKIQKATRIWAIYLLGVIYIGWDLLENEISVQVIRPQTLILDPDAITDEDGYHGEFIGRYRKISAQKLIELAPNYKTYISEEVQDKLATKMTIVEYYTDEYLCWKYKDKIFLKIKNPNWNYDSEVSQTSTDIYGNETPQTITKKGINFFKHPKKPFVFLSVYNLGDKPVDETSLIMQNLSNQDAINKRNKQINNNIDTMNNGLIVSLANSGLTKEQAKNVTTALRNGGVVMVPSGSPSDSIQKMRADSLSPDVFTELQDKRNRLRNIFGVQGISPAGIQNEESVRGKLVIKGLDTDRIGGSISDHLDRMSSEIFGWMVQMMLVYYEHDSLISSLQNLPQLEVLSKEGSMLPNDDAAEASQAMQLAQMGLMSPIDLFKKLEYPNPIKMAADLFLWQNDPTLLLQEDPRIQMFQQKQQAAQQAQQEAQQQQIQSEQQIEQQKIQSEQADKIVQAHESNMNQKNIEEDRKLKLIAMMQKNKPNA